MSDQNDEMKGNSEELLHTVRRVLHDFREMTAENEAASRTISGKPYSLRDFSTKMGRLEEAADTFEHGVGARVERIPYANEVRVFASSAEIEERHESYGLVQISRVSGRHRLFASSIQEHTHFITLRVKRAKRRRSMGKDWYSDHGPSLVEIAMSSAQFAEAITSLNMGLGVPCTIEYDHGVRMDRVPDEEQSEFKAMKDQVKAQLTHRMSEVREAMAEVDSLIDAKKTVSQTRMREIRDVFGRMIREFESGAPFMVERIHEAMETTVAAAKTEIDGMLTHVLSVAGLEHLKNTHHLPGVVGGDKLLVDEVEE